MTRRSKFADPEELHDRDARLSKLRSETVKDITLRVRSATGNEWDERYKPATDDPEAWGRALIAWFNETRREGEGERAFVSVIVHGDVPPPEHNWRKVTAMTQQRGEGRPFDRMVCDRCGITAKRFGIGAPPTRDCKFRAKVYIRCDTTREHLHERQTSRKTKAAERLGRNQV
jgi:hypothetical protein